MPLGMGDEVVNLEGGRVARCFTVGEERVVPKAQRHGTRPRPRLFPEPKGETGGCQFPRPQRGVVLGLRVVKGLAKSPRGGLFIISKKKLVLFLLIPFLPPK